MILERGTRDKLEKYFDINQPLKVTLQIEGAAIYDFCCFGVDVDNKLSDDRYMIFYNQPASPANEIVGKEIQSGMEFNLKLNDLPEKIQKLVFTCSIDGAGTMREISRHKIFLGDKISADFNGADFDAEKAITSLEIYRKNGWRFKIVARGFNGGLDALLKFYGCQQIPKKTSPPPAPVNSETPPRPINSAKKNFESVIKNFPLEKKIQYGAPKLISLVKPLKVALKKRNLSNMKAHVVLALDISGSMGPSYRDGTVQEIIKKILPVAIQFDEELDFWYYGNTCERRPAVTMKNYKNAVPTDWFNLMKKLGYVNNEPVVMKEVVEAYRTSKLPVFVVFITDGTVHETEKIKDILIEASYLPIFWQFVGVRGSDYGILEELDTMSGRYVDNANFFALDDFRSVPNEELYSRLFKEFPLWIKLIKINGVLGGSLKDSSTPPPAEQEKSLSDVFKGILGF